MKLQAANYTSPIATEGTFNNVFVEEKSIYIEKAKKYMSIEFEMYYFKDEEKIELDTRKIAFYGMAGDSVTSNKLAVISVPNEDYDSEVEDSPLMVNVPLLQYLYTHDGVLPEVYDVVDWGYPNFQDALLYFNGGDRNNPEIEVVNPFAKEWIKHNIIIKGEQIGNQFEFVD